MKAKYRIVDRERVEWEKSFPTRRAMLDWVMQGMRECDGAERTHYVNMFCEYQAGNNILHYN